MSILLQGTLLSTGLYLTHTTIYNFISKTLSSQREFLESLPNEHNIDIDDFIEDTSSRLAFTITTILFIIGIAIAWIFLYRRYY